MAPVLAAVLAGRGGRALVFRGDDGLDELSTASTSTVWVVAGGEVAQRSLDPARLGIPVATLEDLRGGDATHNAGVVRDLLAGRPGPVRDAVLLNAAGALVATDAHGEQALRAEQLAKELEDRLAGALAAAAGSVDGGGAADVLERWVQAAGR
jgi:anthranilate phosphoribosyltransferase